MTEYVYGKFSKRPQPMKYLPHDTAWQHCVNERCHRLDIPALVAGAFTDPMNDMHQILAIGFQPLGYDRFAVGEVVENLDEPSIHRMETIADKIILANVKINT